jgi:methionyl aminopeptidase
MNTLRKRVKKVASIDELKDHTPMQHKKKIVNGVYIKSEEQIEGIRRAGELVGRTLKMLGEMVKPGIKTEEINRACHEYTLGHGAIPAPLNYNGFPKSVCVSVNEVVCHGIPGNYVLQDGDLVNIDVTSILNGYYADSNFTFYCGAVDEVSKKLTEVTFESLVKGIEQIFPDNHLSNIGFKIQKHAEKRGYSVVRDYTGHGVGLEFHEPPTVLHYGRPNRGVKLMPGMVFTVEPMINLGGWETVLDKKDGWTVRTKDGRRSAQFEHSCLVTQNGVEILTWHPELWKDIPRIITGMSR